MKIIDSHLTPLDFHIDEDKRTAHYAILGTCIAEHIANAANSAELRATHYLTETWLHTPLPEFNWNEHDAAIIHLTLRHILDMAAGIGRGDIAYIADDRTITNITQRAKDILVARINEMLDSIGGRRPVFFLAFIEPPQTTRGVFFDNRKNTIYRIVRDLNDAMSDCLQGKSGAYFIEVNDIMTYYGNQNGADSYFQHFTHGGFFNCTESNLFYLTILQRVVGALKTLKGTEQIKLIITDLDNTLWKGVAAEEDEIIPWAHIEGWPIGYVEALLECKRRGILLAICSKNDEQKTIDNFDKIWGEKLSLNDFCSAKINWDRKSINILKILEETNILPGSALFIDDNPLEIEEVRQSIPNLRSLSYPAEHWRNVLLHSPYVQVVDITEESTKRTQLIQAKIQRDSSLQSMPREEWLRSLNLKLRFDEINRPDDPRFARAFELLNKTNQFNTTGEKWALERLNELLSQGGTLLSVSAEDRFANHGLISVAVLRDSNIIQVVLSCRVFGLGIEAALLKSAMDRLIAAGHTVIRALYRDSGRNATSHDFYSKHGFQEISDGIFEGSTPPKMPEWIRLVD